jgi:hypothetical protein
VLCFHAQATRWRLAPACSPAVLLSEQGRPFVGLLFAFCSRAFQQQTANRIPYTNREHTCSAIVGYGTAHLQALAVLTNGKSPTLLRMEVNGHSDLGEAAPFDARLGGSHSWSGRYFSCRCRGSNPVPPVAELLYRQSYRGCCRTFRTKHMRPLSCSAVWVHWHARITRSRKSGVDISLFRWPHFCQVVRLRRGP